MKKFEEKTTKTTPIYDGKIVKLQVDDVTLPNGNVAKREIIKHPGAVAVIAVTDEGKLVLVEQFRKALERSIVEIPAGKLEPGEEPIVTARRELEEETGYGAQSLTYLQAFATSPGFADEIIHLFVAKDLYKIENKANLDEDEFVELVEVSLEEAGQMVADERIYDAKTAFAVLWLAAQ
ncbi:ADP-ribose pyrophosphatase [Lysinibacillus sphaericus]|uniref:NUDIX domain-containing protein n=1 Tax=Lysinibacillus sphaericus TaxID=1421 RepID=UPI0018CEE9BE|nr:NUDIX hydrolase [Lysinibacillus sphaericus]MBG9456599.1 ADP-ribose pyrophosphatase [Lysinibacillus sphaericus]MBG9479999.1 ADP-ribose pyrophosphatase [Lysinibacillus sphaericus]MBG9594210.1 ADP-ribose pyrophosphatase [Lysinibacillus sphaericus]